MSTLTCPNPYPAPLLGKIKMKMKAEILTYNPTKIAINQSPSACIRSNHSALSRKTFRPLSPFRSSASASDLPIDAADAIEASKQPTLKSRLQNGEILYGIFLCSFSPLIAEISGLAGYDFVVVDMEHGYGGITDALHCLQALAATQTPAILRLPETSAAWAKKALDLGPQGIMFPMVESAKEAKKAVSYCRYPPNGIRGAAHTIVRASGYGIDAGYLEKCEEELLIMCQVESADAAKKIEDIAGVDGVDAIQMGPLDLSASMGYLWDPGNKKVKDVMRAAEKALLKKSNGVGDAAYLAGFAMPHDTPRDLKLRGYHMVTGTVDIGLFRSAVVDDVKKFKMSLIEDRDSDEEGRGDGRKDDDDEKYWSE